MKTQHAVIRAQQRGIPPFIEELLDRHGREQHDGHGGIIKYLDKKSRRDIQRDMGHRLIARCSEWLNAYKYCTTDGLTITVGHRYDRIRKP